jgi:hypothetical protein
MTIDQWRVTFKHWRVSFKPRRLLEIVAVAVILIGLLIELGADDESWGFEMALVGCVLFVLARLASWVRHGSRQQTPG